MKTALPLFISPVRIILSRKPKIVVVIVGKEKHFLPAGQDMTWCYSYGNQYGGFSKIKCRTNL